MRIILKASNVAAIIGRNKYKPRQEVMDELWKKHKPQTFKSKTRDDKAEASLAVSAEAQRVFENALKIETKNSTQVQKVFKDAQEAINSDPKLNDKQKEEVIDHIRSKVYMTHGTRSEDKTADTVSVNEGVKLTRDDNFYTIPVCEISDNKYIICGKVDRIEERPDGSRILVEIKNRTNRIFGSVPEYEYIQVQVYLQMLGLVHARVVEQYNNQVMSHDVTRDETFWKNKVMPYIEDFCKELDEKLS